MSHSLRVVRNIGSTLGTQIFSWLLTLGVTLYLPRYVGARGLGELGVAGSFVALTGLPIMLGTSTVLVRDIARDHAAMRRLVIASLFMRLLTWPAAVLIGVAAAVLLRYQGEELLIIVVSMTVAIFAYLGDVTGSALRGLEEFPRVNAATLADKFLSSIVTIALIFVRAPLWAIVAGSAAGGLVSLAITWTVLRRHLTATADEALQECARPLIDWSAMRTLATASLPFLTTAVFTAIYAQADALLLSKLSTIEAVGWYSLARRLIGSTMFIPVAVCSAMLPTLSRLYHKDAQQFDAVVSRLFNLILICVVPFVMILVLVPNQLLAVLHYPAGFRNAIPVLMVSAGSMVMWYLSVVAGIALTACDRQASLGRATGFGALACVPTSVVCILATDHIYGNGAIGASISNMLVELGIFILYVRGLPPRIFGWANLGILARAAAAALPLVVLAYFSRSKADMVLLLIAGGAVYLPACWAMRCLHPQDVSLLAGLFRKRTA